MFDWARSYSPRRVTFPLEGGFLTAQTIRMIVATLCRGRNARKLPSSSAFDFSIDLHCHEPI